MLSILIIYFKPIYLCWVHSDCCFYEYILHWGVFMRRSLLSGRFFSATCRDFLPIWSFSSTASLQISSVYRIPPPTFPRIIPRLESSGSCMVSDCLGETVPLQLSLVFAHLPCCFIPALLWRRYHAVCTCQTWGALLDGRVEPTRDGWIKVDLCLERVRPYASTETPWMRSNTRGSVCSE